MAEVIGMALPGEALAPTLRKKATTVMEIVPTVLPTMDTAMVDGITDTVIREGVFVVATGDELVVHIGINGTECNLLRGVLCQK